MIISSESCNEPTGASLQPKVIVTLIHGTFSQEAAWVRPGSLLRSRLETEFGNRIGFPSSPFKWSGDNNLYARWNAGEQLAEHIKMLRATYPGSRHILIAHSHGGNVALHALKYMGTRKDMQADAIAGIACLATPFQSISLRDERLFNGYSMASSVAALWCFVMWSWIWFEPSSWKIAVIWFIGMFPSARLGAFLGRAIEDSRGEAGAIAGLFNGYVASSTNLLIVRKYGDEAALALGASQFLSWAMTKAFGNLSTRDQQHRLFTGRPLPKAVRTLWWVALVGLVTSVGVDTIFLVKEPLVKYCLSFLAFPAMTATLLVKTTFFDRSIFGAVVLLLACAISLTSFTVGTSIPRRWLARKSAGSFKRWFLGVLFALQLDVNVEATPPGRWLIEQFVRHDKYPSMRTLDFSSRALVQSMSLNDLSTIDDDNLATSKVLLHSLYDDQRVIDAIIEWLLAITNEVIE